MSESPKDVVPPVVRDENVPSVGFVTAGHAVLFQDTEPKRCDVCAGPLGGASRPRSEAGAPSRPRSEAGAPSRPRSEAGAPSTDAQNDEDEDGGFDLGGRGLLVWSRGEERRYQEPPLCSACATAIGVSALQRWEIEEEEG